MALELLPLLAKLTGPPTLPGVRIATDYVIDVERHLRRRKVAVEEGKIEETLRSVMTEALLEALATRKIRSYAGQLLSNEVTALVPIEVFRTLMRDIEAGQLELQATIRRFPQCASVLTEAWRKCIDEMLKQLRDTSASLRQSAA
jgi:hypothetical protein